MALVCWFLGVAAAALISPAYPYNTYRTPIYTKSCGYYENPVFKLDSRTGEAQPVILIDNRLRKESSYDPSGRNYQLIENTDGKYQAKTPLMYFPNMASLYNLDFHTSGSEEESKPDYDNEKLWKVGEIPVLRDFKTLPDVYAGSECGGGNQEDAPPNIDDLIGLERSELTEEAHDLGDLELQETFLKDPGTEPDEIILETVTTRPEQPSTENPAVAMLKKKVDKKKGSEVETKKKEEKVDVPVIEENDAVEDVASLVTEKIEAAISTTQETILEDSTGDEERDEDQAPTPGSSLL